MILRNHKLLELMEENSARMKWTQYITSKELLYGLKTLRKHELDQMFKNTKISFAREIALLLADTFVKEEDLTTEIKYSAEGYVFQPEQLYLLLEEAYKLGLTERPMLHL